MTEGEPRESSFCEHGNEIGACPICALSIDEPNEAASGKGPLAEEGEKIEQEEALAETPHETEWLRISEIGEKLGRDWATIKKAARPYREEHPEWFDQRPYKRERGGKLAEFFAPELTDLLRQEFEKIPEATTGWLTSAEIGTFIKRQSGTVASAANAFRESHPEWFKTLRHENGKPFEYYAPQLVNELVTELTKHEAAPEGWLTAAETARTLSASHGLVTRRAETFRESRPEWFQEYLSPQNVLLEYFSPELISELSKEPEPKSAPEASPLEGITPEAPSGWKTRGTLADELNVGERFVQKILENHSAEHPEWFQEFRGKGNGGKSFFLAPELIDIVKAEIQDRPSTPAPEGWLTRRQVAIDQSISNHTIKAVAETFRESHPEWFQLYLDRASKPAEHYAPELIAHIRSELQNREYAPEGWMNTSALTNSVGTSFRTVQRIVEEYEATNPEWFKDYYDQSGRKNQHFSPALVELVRNELARREPAPEGWVTQKNLAHQAGRSRDILLKFDREQRDVHPDWFREYTTPHGMFTEHYSPEFAATFLQEVGKREPAPEGWLNTFMLAEKTNIHRGGVLDIVNRYRSDHPDWFAFYDSETRGRHVEHYSPELVERVVADVSSRESAPPGWLTKGELERSLQVSATKIDALADPYRETNPDWFNLYRTKKNILAEHFSPELVSYIQEKVNTEPGEAPEGWITTHQLTELVSRSYSVVQDITEKQRSQHPDWFQDFKDKGGRAAEHLSPELVSEVRRDLGDREAAPEGWMTNWALGKRLEVHQKAPEAIAEKYRSGHPEWFRTYDIERGTAREHYSPELVAIITNELSKRETDKPPEGWLTISETAEVAGVHSATVKNVLNEYRETHPEWFGQYFNKVNQRTEHYAPQLIEQIKARFEDHPSVRRERLREAGLVFEKIADSETGESKEFRALINVFGSSHAVDLLYRLHPSFRRIPTDRVGGMLAQYLGDFLLVKTSLDVDGLEQVKDLSEFLTDGDLREGFLEVVKGDCLSHYQEKRRADPNRDAQEIINEYFEVLKSRVGTIQSGDLLDALEEAESYYASLFERQEKPSRIVDQLREGRVFPDINQRINIKEIGDKKRMLIGDEMGLGKSASAILSKEYLGAKCALIVSPSNVIPTWQEYLSDQRGSNGNQIGYFQPGEAPRVLTVESPEDLKDIEQGAYDYVIISQERLNERHMTSLGELDYDMLIVDEIHKLKNVMSGKRSQRVIDLARRIEGDDNYLVMLSGTPIPNKIGDTALLLKMLYPERFEQMGDDELARTIVHGDVVEIRNLLVPRMQTKRLQESLDMPPLSEENVPVELSRKEEEIYEVLLEEDELTATEKMAALRQFLLNPELLEVAPDISSAKIEALNRELNSAFGEHNSVVVYVNGYIEDVIRGQRAIFTKLDLPQGVETLVIEGNTPKAERQRIQQRIQQGGSRTLVFVSGQTADVGINLSQAEHVIFYNEPWTEYDKQQELARVYREGHTLPLESRTLIIEKTIEDGIHQYIGAKRKAIEKVLRGIPRTEMETRLLEQDEMLLDENLEVNPELAEYYFSAWDRMLRIFGHVREMGEEEFKKFLDVHGEDYADCYSELGSRTYQANNSRVVGSMFSEMIRNAEASQERPRILDIGSGPEMLRKHLPESLQEAVVSLDINKHQFTRGPGKKTIGSFTQLPYRDKSIDYANLAMSLHYTKFLPGRGELERLRVLAEMNRVLKVGARGVISNIYNIEFKDPEATVEAFNALGFRVVDEYSGEAATGENYKAHILTVEKVEDIPETQSSSGDLEALAERMTSKTLSGLKFKRQKGFRLKNSRRIIDHATLATSEGNKEIPVTFNESDTRIFQEEQSILSEGRGLIDQYKSIDQIPVETLQSQGFSRLIAGKHFILFKKLEQGEGAVIVR